MGWKSVIHTVAAVFIFIFAIPSFAVMPEGGADGKRAAPHPNDKQGELLIKFKAGIQVDAARDAIYAKGHEVVEARQFRGVKHSQAGMERWWVVKFAEGVDTEKARADLAADPLVEVVEFNYEVRVQPAPNTSLINEVDNASVRPANVAQ